MLGKIGEDNVVPDHPFACIERFHAGKDTREGRFPGAVWPHDSDTIPPLDLVLQSLEHLLRSVTLREVHQLHNDTATRLRLREPEMDLFLLRLDLDQVHFLQLLDAALHLPRLRRLVPEPVDELLRLLDPVLLVLVGVQEEGFPDLLFLLVERIVPRVLLEVTHAHGKGFRRETVKESPVVRDENDGSIVVVQVFLEPLQGVDIEMVRRFVQKEQ